MIEFFEDEAGGHRFRVKGRNGEIIVTSESYTRHSDAVRGLLGLCRAIADWDPGSARSEAIN
jgi:uncharacterized protein YegP (UPF0339 family)